MEAEEDAVVDHQQRRDGTKKNDYGEVESISVKPSQSTALKLRNWRLCLLAASAMGEASSANKGSVLRNADWDDVVEGYSIKPFKLLSIANDLSRVGSPQGKSANLNITSPSHQFPIPCDRSVLEYQPIQVYVGSDLQEIPQPSTSSSFATLHDSQQETKVLQRIQELRNAGLWSDTRLPMCVDPPRPKLHWDYLLEEVQWMATDFRQERMFKRRMARKFAFSAKAFWRQKFVAKSDDEQKKKQERDAKRVCSSIAKMIREFWRNVDKLVDIRANEIIENQKKRAMDRHLKFLVGEADKISSALQERLVGAESPTHSHRTKSSVKDDDFASESGEDDEMTIETEEKLAKFTPVEHEQEVNALSKEAEMDFDDLLSTLPADYLDYLGQLGYNVSSTSDKAHVESSINGRNSVASTAAPSQSALIFEDESAEQTNQSSSDSVGTSTTITVTGDELSKSSTDQGIKIFNSMDQPKGLQNVDFEKLKSKDSADRRQQLDNIADAAMEFQPTGFTLETTQVKTDSPFLLRGELREYQLVGLDWLVTLYEKNLNGILADEMGLGKTIQTIALLAHLASDRTIWGPHLIIVPTSVILNWEMEVKKWCPSFKIITYFGTAKERAEKRKGWSKSNSFHICITSYKLAIQDIRVFKNRPWQYLILDEAQNIKNFKSQRWQTLLNLRSRRRLLLTGTPLQNSLMELWSLLHFLMPNVFSSHEDFREWFSNPLSRMVEGNKELDSELVGRLHKILRPFILRRLKSEVEKQLPTKTEKVIYCPLSKRQRFLYNEFMCRRSTRENLESGNMLSVLGIIMQLRKCCNHPNLFEPRPVLSPYATFSVPLHLPSLAFFRQLTNSIEQDTMSFLSIQRYQFASLSVWQLFSEVTANEAIQHDLELDQKEEERLPVVESVKFSIDRRFKTWTMYEAHKVEDYGSTIINGVVASPNDGSIKDKDSSIKKNSKNGINTSISNSRKRKAMLDLDTSMKTKASKTSTFVEGAVLLGPSSSPNFGSKTAALMAEIHSENLRKSLQQNYQIGLWLSQLVRLAGRPYFPTELISLVKVVDKSDDEFRSFLSLENDTAKHKRFLPDLDLFFRTELRKELFAWFGRILMDWAEAAIRRFGLCVEKVILADPHPDPRPITAISTFESNLDQHHSRSLYAQQNSIAHQVQLCSLLEFPEIRLIEYDCGKLQILSQLLQRLIENKHRCLIFTQMSKMLDILQSFLSYHNYKYFRLDGSTRIDQRQAMMERFNSDPSVFCFILSTRSGGIGVNLTGADTVIFYDSDWNPTMDAQAQDRCHRIGQTRDVTIYRLISEKTIEENILKRANEKRRLGEMALDEAEFTPQFFRSANNIRELFSNEDAVKDLIVGVPTVLPKSTKEIEIAMAKLEDTQDAADAVQAKEEYRLDNADFDEGSSLPAMSTVPRSSNLEHDGGPSERYMELIKQLKPVERYAVNFLEQEYRPELEEEMKETEAAIFAKKEEFLKNKEALSALHNLNNLAGEEDDLPLTYDSNEEMIFYDPEGNRVALDEIPMIWMPPSPPNSETDPLYVPLDGFGWYEPGLMTEDRLPPPVAPSTFVDPLLVKVRQQQSILPKAVSPAELPRKLRKISADVHPESAHEPHIVTASRTTKSPELSVSAAAFLDGTPHDRPAPEIVATPGTVGRGPRRRRRLCSTTTIASTTSSVDTSATTFFVPSSASAALHNVVISPATSGRVTPLLAVANVLPETETTTVPPFKDEKMKLLVPDARHSSMFFRRLSADRQSIVSEPSKSIVNTVDECIENVRRAHVKKNPPIPYISQMPMADGKMFHLPCTEPRASNFLAYQPTIRLQYPIQLHPTSFTESENIQSPPWTSDQDYQLFNAIESQSLSTQLVEQNQGIAINWELVANSVNSVSFPLYRSPRQCSKRYNDISIRNCIGGGGFGTHSASSEHLSVKRGPGRRMSSSQQSTSFRGDPQQQQQQHRSGSFVLTPGKQQVQRHHSSAAASAASKLAKESLQSGRSQTQHQHQLSTFCQPGQVYFDQSTLGEDIENDIKRRAKNITRSSSQRKESDYRADSIEQHQQKQPLCLSGRLPENHEAYLTRFGVRYSSVQRPSTFLLEGRSGLVDPRLVRNR